MWNDAPRLRFVSNVLFALVALALGAFAIHAASRLPIFALREVRVDGATEHVTRAQVDVVVRTELRGNFFSIDLDAARAAFEKLPWVRRAQVRRAWPDRLDVVLEERVALARWGDDGLVDTHGEVFVAASDARLPTFTGPAEAAPDLARRYATLRTLLAPLGREPVEIEVSARRAWSVRLDDGLRIELGRDGIEARLARFVLVYGRTVAALPDRPTVVDLRYPNGFAVRSRVAPPAAVHPKG